MDAIELLARWRAAAADVTRYKAEIRGARAKLQTAATELRALEAEGRRRGISFPTTETATGVEGELHGRGPSRS